MKSKMKSFVKCIIFVVIFLFCFKNIQNVLIDKSVKDYKKIHGFFEEPENTLDAVFVGSSATYAFWNPLVAWAEKGIAVYSVTNASQPFEIAPYIIDDARKTQPDALYIVNATRMMEDDEYDTVRIHRFLRAYPETQNKYNALNFYLERSDMSWEEKMECYFPIIRFHERWSELDGNDFEIGEEPYKSASRYSSYLEDTKAQRKVEIDFSAYGELTENMRIALENMMTYCKEEDVKVLFVLMPQAIRDEVLHERQNTVVRILEENGFDVLDLRGKTDEMGIDYRKHFHDKQHTNIHGSIRITNYISDYLIENYQFTDKRNDEVYNEWNEAWVDYYDLISEHLLPEDYDYLKTTKESEETTISQ
ncbi:MAG: hypothetical protein IJO60_01700 [Agathobacter sp.]|nr:hypothetical protein [Agathobacter sp.]